MKHIFTRKQAVSLIHQVKNGIDSPNFMAHVDPGHPLFKLSNDDLMARLCEFIDEDSIAGVVEEIE